MEIDRDKKKLNTISSSLPTPAVLCFIVLSPNRKEDTQRQQTMGLWDGVGLGTALGQSFLETGA